MPHHYPSTLPTGQAYTAVLEPILGRRSVIIGYHGCVRINGAVVPVGKWPVGDGQDPAGVREMALDAAGRKAAEVAAGHGQKLTLEDWK